jgi:hypothetical protein
VKIQPQLVVTPRKQTQIFLLTCSVNSQMANNRRSTTTNTKNKGLLIGHMKINTKETKRA